MDNQADTRLSLLPGIKVFFLIFLGLSGCEKEGIENNDMFYEIPGELKFLFEEGDSLSYQCTDGSVQSFLVNDISFRGATGIRQNLFYDSDDTYSIEICEIEFLCEKDDWDKHIGMDCVYDINYKLIFDQTIFTWGTFNPHSTIERLCTGGRTWDVAFSPHVRGTYFDTVINEIEYRNCFTYQIHPDRISEGDDIYRFIWNMNYGIIQFEVIDVTPELSWSRIP